MSVLVFAPWRLGVIYVSRKAAKLAKRNRKEEAPVMCGSPNQQDAMNHVTQGC